jgi:hypothetical protein
MLNKCMIFLFFFVVVDLIYIFMSTSHTVHVAHILNDRVVGQSPEVEMGLGQSTPKAESLTFVIAPYYYYYCVCA